MKRLRKEQRERIVGLAKKSLWTIAAALSRFAFASLHESLHFLSASSVLATTSLPASSALALIFTRMILRPRALTRCVWGSGNPLTP